MVGALGRARAAIPPRVARGERKGTTKSTKHTKNNFEPQMHTNGASRE